MSLRRLGARPGTTGGLATRTGGLAARAPATPEPEEVLEEENAVEGEEEALEENAEEGEEEAAPAPVTKGKPAPAPAAKGKPAPAATAPAPKGKPAPAAPAAKGKPTPSNAVLAGPVARRKVAEMPEEEGGRVTQENLETAMHEWLRDPDNAEVHGLFPPEAAETITRVQAVNILRAPFTFLIRKILPKFEARVMADDGRTVIFKHTRTSGPEGRVYRNPRSQGESDSHVLNRDRVVSRCDIIINAGTSEVGSLDADGNFVPLAKPATKAVSKKKK